MPSKIWGKIGMFAAGLLVGCILLTLWRNHFATDADVVSKVETLTIRDTITIVKPISKVERVTDTIRIITPPVTDTLRIRDTIYLPITQKYYKAKDYEAWVSGYSPRLDSIRVFPATTYITKEIKEKPKRWGLGLQIGIGAGVVNNKIVGVPYVGVGISYDIVRW